MIKADGHIFVLETLYDNLFPDGDRTFDFICGRGRHLTLPERAAECDVTPLVKAPLRGKYKSLRREHRRRFLLERV